MSGARRLADGVALLLGLASFVGGLGVAMLIPYAIYLHLVEDGSTWRSLLYNFSGGLVVSILLTYIGVPLALGGAGLILVRRRRPTMARVSLAGSAARFSSWGLGVGGLLMAAVVGLVGLRLWLWGW